MDAMADDPQVMGIRIRQSKKDSLERIGRIEGRSVADLVDEALGVWIRHYGPIPTMPAPKLSKTKQGPERKSPGTGKKK